LHLICSFAEPASMFLVSLCFFNGCNLVFIFRP
jgi:hypothetical protein